ncbi:glycosyltransferase [Xanthobacter agilis]|uniref:glycosyltransferase family 2 protein n=2 Tax=Xanthobacter agilis TaxID=47492 RepID=UPI003728ABED
MEAARAGKGPPGRQTGATPDARVCDPGIGPARMDRRPSDGPVLPVELAACVGLLPAAFLSAVHDRARRVGAGGDEVLRCAGRVRDDEMAQVLADHLGLPLVQAVDGLFVPASPVPAAVADWAKGLLRTGVHAGFDASRRVVFTLAVRGRAVRRLARALRVDPSLRARLRLIAPDALRRQVMEEAGEAIAHDAAFAFRDAAPDRSAGALKASRALLALTIVIAAVAGGGAVLAPELTFLATLALLSLIFLSWIALRLAGCRFDADDAEPLPAQDPAIEDRHLPVYTLLIPLYKEAASVPRLLAAMRALDYPPEKLDIKLVVEADDGETRAAIAAAGLPPQMEEVVVPNVGPRTKPKALNMGLTFARGTYVAVFDAEDQPEEDQLRRAVAAFRRGGRRVACVQAKLCVDNGAERWISGHFAAEYAGQFDVLLPILSALNLPILLGGTSNHFRRDVLEDLGGWDAFNVTEDADLGIRLARTGWRTEVIASTTFEEAPVTLGGWLGQRTRWFKGWAQTLLVHGRHPRSLLRDLGWRGAATVGVLTLGPFVSALLHPFGMALLGWNLARGTLGALGDNWMEVFTSALTYATLAVGYGGTALTMSVGLARRGDRLRGSLFWTIPLYWLLLSLAAWRAVIELIRRPYHWEKTAHGISTRRLPLWSRRLRNSA